MFWTSSWLRYPSIAPLPEIANGHMKIPTGPGWGTELNEKAARKYAWTG